MIADRALYEVIYKVDDQEIGQDRLYAAGLGEAVQVAGNDFLQLDWYSRADYETQDTIIGSLMLYDAGDDINFGSSHLMKIAANGHDIEILVVAE